MNTPPNDDIRRRIVVAITGATGSIYGVRVLEALRQAGVETHFLSSKWGARTLTHETSYTTDQLQELADFSYSAGDQSAVISSGSYVTDGMIIAPCSMRTLGAIAHGLGDNLIHRAADVVLKENRKLVLAVRESPFNQIHLDNMLRLSRMGVVICPPLPAFYNHPRTIEDVVDHTVGRLLDQFGIHLDLMPRWTGKMAERGKAERE